GSDGAQLCVGGPTPRRRLGRASPRPTPPAGRRPMRSTWTRRPGSRGCAKRDKITYLPPPASIRMTVIDCHGHYTTAPKPLEEFRKRQIAALKDPAQAPTRDMLRFNDDEMRASVQSQLKFQSERGTDVTIFSPRAAGIAPPIG